jgi:hypothetical protein
MKRNNKEDKIHKEFSKQVNILENTRNLNCIHWGYSGSGEKRNLITGALLKAKGLKKGEPDYHFFYKKDNILNILFLEFKSDTGKQSEDQKYFEDKFKNFLNCNYFIARSEREGIDILEALGIAKGLL